MTLVTIETPKQDHMTPGPKWYRSPRLVRHAVMAFFFVFLLHVAIQHLLRGGGPNGSPSVEAYCPFGGVETLYQFLTTGGFVRRIEPSALVLLGVVLVLTLLFSRGFCGWICPFGAVQEWIGMLGRKLFRGRGTVPGKWQRRLRYLKYVVLLLIVGFTWHQGTLVFRAYDPFLAFFHLGHGISEMPWAYAALALVLAGSLLYDRFFCQFACPLGAVLGLLGRFGLTKIVREENGCKACNLCQRKCPAGVEFLTTDAIRDPECNHCLECLEYCPKPGVLTLRGSGWHVAPQAYALMLVAGLAAFVGVSKAAAAWRTLPAAVSFAGAGGRLDPEQIRGYMTLREIARGYAIPMDRLYAAAHLPGRVSPDTRLNKIASEYEVHFEPDAICGVVRSLLVNGNPPGTGAGNSPKPEIRKQHQPGAPEPEVKGFMTLNEIAAKTGAPIDWLRGRLGLGADIDGRTPVREWMHARGMSIQDLRDAVDEYRRKPSAR